VAQEALSLSPPVEDDQAVAQAGAEVVEGRSEQGEALEFSGDAGLEEYAAAALTGNPGIRQAIRNIQVLGYRVPQVTSLEDPMITLIPPTGDMTETAAGMMDGQIGISQRLPFPGRLSRRGKIAEQEVRMAFAMLADARIRTVSDVAKAYYDYYLADVSIGITRESEHFLQVLSGLAPGETVVVSGQFLLDSESRLREAALKFVEPGKADGATPIKAATERAEELRGAQPHTCSSTSMWPIASGSRREQ
jgi:hypothetical protein